MAFSSAIVGESVFGNKRVKWGTYTNGLEALVLQPGGSSAIATAPVVDETLPVSGNAVTIVTADNEDGTWLAIGY
jgi:hypothetical protein